MDDLEGVGVGVVDAPLGVAQRVFEDVDLDPVVGERAGLVEPECLQIARDDSNAATPPASIAETKSVRFSNGVSPAAQRPSRPA